MPKSILALVLLVAACADFEAYQNRLDTWIGRPANQLVAQWHSPQSVLPLRDGGRILLYKTPVVVGMFCETRFTVDNHGVIRRWAYFGNDCGA